MYTNKIKCCYQRYSKNKLSKKTNPNIFNLDNPCGLSTSSHCLNGGTCVSSNTDPPIASCLCPQGFTGSYCNVTAQNDPCASEPCQGRGYCALSTPNTNYSCICLSNYIGPQCERSKTKQNFEVIYIVSCFYYCNFS